MKNDNHVLLKGVSVSPGTITGRVKLVRKNADIRNVKSGDIVVVKESHPSFAVGVMNSSGLICEKGGVLSHICIVSMEMGIPCIAKCRNATEILKTNMVITLDATSGKVYNHKK